MLLMRFAKRRAPERGGPLCITASLVDRIGRPIRSHTSPHDGRASHAPANTDHAGNTEAPHGNSDMGNRSTHTMGPLALLRHQDRRRILFERVLVRR